MKILQVCPRYAPQTGGVEVHVREISERLVDRGHAVIVHTADAGRDGDLREHRNGVEVRRHRGLAPGGSVHFAPGLVRAVSQSDADVVHAHNYHSLPVVFAAVGVNHDRFVVTTHYHGASAHPVRNALLCLYRPVGQWALHRADSVIAVSEWEREQLKTDFGVDARVIPNGLDVHRFTTAVPEERDRPYLLSVGRLEEYKGVQHIIEVLPRLVEYELVVAGDGPYREELERLAGKRGVRDRVSFLGYVDEERLPGLYAGADAFVTLSAFESYGMTVAEALAAGTPCVVRVAGALEDWVSRDAVVGTQTEPEAIEAAIKEAAGLYVESPPVRSWVEVVDRLEDVYVG